MEQCWRIRVNISVPSTLHINRHRSIHLPVCVCVGAGVLRYVYVKLIFSDIKHDLSHPKWIPLDFFFFFFVKRPTKFVYSHVLCVIFYLYVIFILDFIKIIMDIRCDMRNCTNKFIVKISVPSSNPQHDNFFSPRNFLIFGFIKLYHAKNVYRTFS